MTRHRCLRPLQRTPHTARDAAAPPGNIDWAAGRFTVTSPEDRAPRAQGIADRPAVPRAVAAPVRSVDVRRRRSRARHHPLPLGLERRAALRPDHQTRRPYPVAKAVAQPAGDPRTDPRRATPVAGRERPDRQQSDGGRQARSASDHWAPYRGLHRTLEAAQHPTQHPPASGRLELQIARENRKKPRHAAPHGPLVGHAGLEPATSSMSTRRASQLRQWPVNLGCFTTWVGFCRLGPR